jgi:hypothetical protein
MDLVGDFDAAIAQNAIQYGEVVVRMDCLKFSFPDFFHVAEVWHDNQL